MAKTTPILALPYPEKEDSDNVPSDMKALAEAAEAEILAGDLGKAAIIATEQSRTNAAYGLLATPDKVEGLVVPTKALLCIAYSASVKQSLTGSNGRLAFFIGANQLKRDNGSGAPVVVETEAQKENSFRHVSSTGYGLNIGTFGTAYPGDVETGQVVSFSNAGETDGGVCVVFVKAGTYDISVQFKAEFGSITAKERRLYAWVQPFA